MDSDVLKKVKEFDENYIFQSEFTIIEPELSGLLKKYPYPDFPESLLLCRCLAVIYDMRDRWRKGLSDYASEEAIKFFEEAIEKSWKEDMLLKRNLVRLYDVRGKLLYRKSLYGDATIYFQKALQTSSKIIYQEAISDIESNSIRSQYNEWSLANQNTDKKEKKRKVEEMNECYKQAIRYFEKNKILFEKSQEALQGLSSIYHNYALLLWQNCNDYEEGWRYHEKAKEINESLTDNYRLNQTLMNQGLFFFSQWEQSKEKKTFFEQADDYFEKVLSRQRYWPRAVLWILQKRAQYHYAQSNYDEGNRHIRELQKTHKQYVENGSDEDLETLWKTYKMVLRYKQDDLRYKQDDLRYKQDDLRYKQDDLGYESLLDLLIDIGCKIRNQFSFLHYRRRFQKDIGDILQRKIKLQLDRNEIKKAIDSLYLAYNRELVDIISFRKELLPMLKDIENVFFKNVEDSLHELWEKLEIQNTLRQFQEDRDQQASTPRFINFIKAKAEREGKTDREIKDLITPNFDKVHIAYERISENLNLRKNRTLLQNETEKDYSALFQENEVAVLYSPSIVFIIKQKNYISMPLNIQGIELLKNYNPNLFKENVPKFCSDIYEYLVKPIQGYLEGIKRIYLLPYPDINNIPIHAAYDGKQFLFERFEVATLLSLEAFGRKKKTENNKNSKMFIIGNPTKDLRDAEHECKEIIEKAQNNGLGIVKGNIDRNSVIEMLNTQEFKYIHFATHGIIDPSYPLLASILLKDGQMVTASDIIFRANLQNTQVVTLSTCESADLCIEESEAIGMAMAFLAAGSYAVIGGVGEVSSIVSKELFCTFYEMLLNQNMDVFSAWRETCLKQIKKQPGEWPPFVLYL